MFEVLEELDRVASLHRPASAAVLLACLAAPHIAEAAAELRAAGGAHADEDGHFDSAVRLLEPAALAWNPCHRPSASAMLCCPHQAYSFGARLYFVLAKCASAWQEDDGAGAGGWDRAHAAYADALELGMQRLMERPLGAAPVPFSRDAVLRGVQDASLSARWHHCAAYKR